MCLQGKIKKQICTMEDLKEVGRNEFNFFVIWIPCLFGNSIAKFGLKTRVQDVYFIGSYL